MGTVSRLRPLLAAIAAAAVLAACSSTPDAPPAPGASATTAPTGASAAPSAGPSAGTGGYPDPMPLTGDLDAVHDPSMVRAPDGTYLLYSTGDNIQIRTSKDRVAFTRAGSVWPDGAPWTEPFTNPADRAALWAPDISYHNGKFYLYYSASSFGSRNSAIFLATSTTGLSGSWTDLGKVWQTKRDSDYNAIDPNLIVDESGAWWMSFGSFWGGLKMIRIDPATGKQDPQDKKLYSLATRPRSVDGAIEAPYIVFNSGYYYLFASFDACCRGTSSTYRTMVGRAKAITGPYVDRDGKEMTEGGGTEVLASHGGIVGPGHPAVLKDGSDWVLIYHYYYDDLTPTTGKLAMNLLDWADGWPVAR
jgi:arabinan endo-1,5-alpha-L-arabinosidase